MITCADKSCVSAGFHTATLPISAGAVGRLAAIDVKLNGETAKTKPSRGRSSTWFHWPSGDVGCSSISRR